MGSAHGPVAAVISVAVDACHLGAVQLAEFAAVPGVAAVGALELPAPGGEGGVFKVLFKQHAAAGDLEGGGNGVIFSHVGEGVLRHGAGAFPVHQDVGNLITGIRDDGKCLTAVLSHRDGAAGINGAAL